MAISLNRLPVTEADVRVINGELVALHGSGRKTTPIEIALDGADVAIDNAGFAVLGGTTAQEVFESVDFQLDNLGGAFPLDSEEWGTWYDNATGSTELNIIRTDSSDNTVLNAIDTKEIQLSVNEATQWTLDSNGNLIPEAGNELGSTSKPLSKLTGNTLSSPTGDVGTLAGPGHIQLIGAEGKITQSTADGADNRSLILNGGGDATYIDVTRGAVLALYGNEHPGEQGRALIASSRAVEFFTGPSATKRWILDQNGHLVSASSTAYNLGSPSSLVGTVYAVNLQGQNGTITNDLIVEGNLIVSGTQTILNTEELQIEDNIITLNSTASGTPTLDSGFEVNRGDQPYSRLLWDESEDYFVAGISGSEQRIITSSGLETTSNSLRPVIDAGMDLGDASHNFEDLYVRSVQSSASSLTVGTQNASTLYFRTNATQRWQIAHTTGHLTPLTSGTIDIGTSSLPTNRVYTKSVSSPDLLDFLAGGSSQWRIASDGEFKYVGPDANAVIRKDVDGSAVAATLSLYAADVNSVLDTAAIQLSSVANGGNLDLYCGSGGDIRFFNNTGTAHWIINSAGDFLTNRSDTTLIGATTASGSDTAKIVITASDVETSSRSARISLTGNDHAGGAGPGHIDLCSGDDATGYDVQICSGPGSSAGNVKQTWRFNGDRLEFLATSVTTSLITHVNDTSKTLFLTGGDGNLNRGARLKLGGSTTADGEATAGGFRLATASSGTGVGYIDALDSVQFGTGSGYPTRLTVRNSNFNPILITSAAQTGVASPVVQIEVPDTAGNRGGYAIVAASGGGLAGMTAEVVTGGAYPNSEGILDLWYQEGASTQRALRASQADGVALYVDTTKRFELRPDRSIYHKSHDSYADSEYRRETFGYTCTGSGTETAFTLTPISNGTAWVTTRLSAFDGDNNESMWVEIKTGVVRHDSGTASLIGTQVKTSDFQGTASEFWNAEFDTSGNDLRLRVTAVSGVAFTGTFEYQQSLGA